MARPGRVRSARLEQRKAVGAEGADWMSRIRAALALIILSLLIAASSECRS